MIERRVEREVGKRVERRDESGWGRKNWQGGRTGSEGGGGEGWGKRGGGREGVEGEVEGAGGEGRG